MILSAKEVIYADHILNDAIKIAVKNHLSRLTKSDVRYEEFDIGSCKSVEHGLLDGWVEVQVFMRNKSIAYLLSLFSNAYRQAADDAEAG